MLFRRVPNLVKNGKSVLPFEEIPSPWGLPIVGTTLSLLAQGSTPKLHRYIDGRHRHLGPIFKEKLGPVACVFVSDPEEIRNVFAQEGKYPMHVLPEAWTTYNQIYGCQRGLFFMDGPEWWHHRRIMNKLLLKGDLTWIDESCNTASDNLLQELLKYQMNGSQSLETILYKWSLDVIIALLLGAEGYAKHSTNLEADIAKVAKTVELVFGTTATLSLIPAAFASKYNIPRWKRFVKSVDDALGGAELLVSRLKDAITPNSGGLLEKLLEEDLTSDNINRIIIDLILAAGDTTAVAMEWMLYLIAKHPAIQPELRNDKDLEKLVLKETLRLYPVAPFLTRILPEDATVCGYTIPKHTLIILSIYTTGRDERFFPNPNDFNPRRWDRNKNEDYNIEMQKASLPFAIGLRSCIGRKIAEIQLQTALRKIVNTFNVQILNQKDVEIVLKMVAVPAEPLKLKFQML